MFELLDTPEFSVRALTVALNQKPFVPGQLARLGIFEEDGQASTTVKVERQGNGLSVIDPTPRGGPGVTVAGESRELIPFEMHHFQIDDAVYADEVQGVRRFGSDNELEAIEDRIDAKLENHAARLDTTLEHSRVGAIKGIVTSGSGQTLHDLYARFDIPVPAPVSLGIGAGDVAGLDKLLDDNVRFPVEDELDMAYGHIHAMTGRNFHNLLWQQKAVREVFLNRAGAEKLLQGVPDVFEFGNIIWERYRTGRSARTANGGVAFIGDDEARVFPVGAMGLFITRFGPADWRETVNTIGLPRYAKMKPTHDDKAVDLWSQSNFINLCTKPAVLRRITIN